MLRNEGDRLRRIVVCSPRTEYFQVKNYQAHNFEEAPDPELARRQHDELKSVLRGFGCEVIDIPELEDHPNSVFTRDTALCTPAGYIKLRMGLPTRRGEEEWMARALESIGEPCAGVIQEPGTVEGGDVILAGSVAFISLSDRTNREGLSQVSRLLKVMGYEVRVIDLPPRYLHIGGAMSMTGPGSVLCCRGVFPGNFFDGFERIEVSCEVYSGGNIIPLGDGEVIVDRANVDAIKKMEREGLIVHAVDLSEFVKGRGGPSCLILPVDREPST